MQDEKALALLRLTDKEETTPKETIQKAIEFYIQYSPELLKFNPGVKTYETLSEIVQNYLESKRKLMKKAKDNLTVAEAE